jgi:hypothetical protein
LRSLLTADLPLNRGEQHIGHPIARTSVAR